MLLITLPSIARWFPILLSFPQKAWKDPAWEKSENVFKGNLEDIQKSLQGGLHWEAPQGSQRPQGRRQEAGRLWAGNWGKEAKLSMGAGDNKTKEMTEAHK